MSMSFGLNSSSTNTINNVVVISVVLKKKFCDMLIEIMFDFECLSTFVIFYHNKRRKKGRTMLYNVVREFDFS